jgi:perosamine synthetase
MASYSFENSKHLSCGEGGILITDHEKYAELARKVGGHGYKNLKAEEGRVKLNQSVFQNPDYKRFDTLGWNYRLSEFSAAIALAQLERVDEFVELRVKAAEIFIEVMNDTDFLIPQECPKQYTNSYYTLGALYKGKEKLGISWIDFRQAYIDNGGDGFYGACAVPYLEPAIENKAFEKRLPEVYKKVNYKKGLCPVAEGIQKNMMQFKTNYRDIELAKAKAEALRKTIKRLSR